jgi:LuxR family transcriptional regulator, maltose regulon positive regulatory protein
MVRTGLVPRVALLDRLSRTTAQPLVLLVAPPGYGKTTVLTQWIEQDGRTAAWVTVEDADNDPSRILDRLAAALPEQEAQPVRREPTVSRLLQQITVAAHPVVIVLDDIQRLHRGPVPDLLVDLAIGLPRGSQLVVAGRSTQHLRVGRLRAEGRCAEFGRADLAFTAEEARQALVLTGVDVDDDDLRLLVDRTEGWPVGVYLAALGLLYDVEVSDAPGGVTGDDAYIADYFRDELLALVPPDTVTFLLRTAVLEQLSAPLCDAVLDTDDSAARLAEIERRNLFVVPLDRRRQEYRYHRLFAEALIAELRRREPGQERRMHLRAAAWYRQQGRVEQAVDHLIAGNDRAEASRLVNQHGSNFIGVGRIATVRRWMDILGPDAVGDYPPVAVTAAWTAALSGETEHAQQLLLAAERASCPGLLPDGHSSLEASTAVLRAMMGAQGVERMLVDARRAHDLEPPGSPWNALAATVLGIALVLSGAQREAIQHLEHVALLGREHRRVEAAVALAQLSLLAAERRDPLSADRHAAEARENLVAIRVENSVTAVLTYLAGATASLLRGDREAARRQLGMTVRHYLNVPPTAFPWLAAQTALGLGAVSIALRDVDAARVRLDDARRHLARLPDAGVLREGLAALSATVDRAGNIGGGPSAMSLSAAEEGVLRLLPTHLSLREIGNELHISHNTVKTHVRAIYRKLQCGTRAEAVKSARPLGLLSP